MPRSSTGQVLGRRRPAAACSRCASARMENGAYVTLGTSDEGWTRRRAEDELANVLADVRRGVWRPHQPDTADVPAADPTFHEFASEWFAARRGEWRESTQLDYQWQLTHHLLPFFAKHRLSQITVAEVDRYRERKVREGLLAAESINKTITRLGQILEVAVERDLAGRNPVRINPRNRKLKASKQPRTYLDRADQIASLLDAAGELDQEARVDRRHVPRRAILATLVFAGLRLGELCGLRWREVDLATGRIRVGHAKTDAGVRLVDMAPALRDELLAWKARAPPTTAWTDYVFATLAGGEPRAATTSATVSSAPP